MKEKASAWHCNCGELLRPYQLNLAELRRGAVCGVARRSEPNRDQEREARIPFAGLQRSWQHLSMIDSSRKHGLLDSRLLINGLRPRDLEDRPFTVVSPVPIASVS
jgi:hypothetical protein